MHSKDYATNNPEEIEYDTLEKSRVPEKSLSEDWWAVIIGVTIILAVLSFAWLNPGTPLQTPVYKWQGASNLFGKVLSAGNLLLIGIIGICFFVLTAVAVRLSGGSLVRFAAGFMFIFVVGVLSLVIAGNGTIGYYGIEYVVFALIIGLIIGNTGTLPNWLREAARSEFYIKTGLVVLGSSILFTEIVQAGLPGILQAIIVVIAVWSFSMWLSRRLKVDDEFGVILASAVSICGVSAAIVAAGAIKADKKKLSYVTTLVLLVAIPMMIVMPWIVKQFHIPEVVAGAWLGGTLDTTASVTAASDLVGPLALKAGVIVKFSQNVLIGVAAIFIAAWWTMKKTIASPGSAQAQGIGVIWERFPKFVLGFIAASLVFSFLIHPNTTRHVAAFLNSLRTIWFAMAFVAIGLEARFGDLVKIQGGRPAITFVGAQLFNIIWTLLWAYLLFGGVLLPVPL